MGVQYGIIDRSINQSGHASGGGLHAVPYSQYTCSYHRIVSCCDWTAFILHSDGFRATRRLSLCNQNSLRHATADRTAPIGSAMFCSFLEAVFSNRVIRTPKRKGPHDPQTL